MTTTTTAARPEVLHACIDCRALPEAPAGWSPPKGSTFVRHGYRPRKPAPTTGGPRSQRCTFHKRAHKLAQRQAASDARSRKRSGLDEDARQLVLAEQGGRCPCGRQASRGNLDADHDHALAAQHDHADDVACEECMRGFLCRSCNRNVIGALAMRRSTPEVAAVLRALADYLDDPPARRALASRTETAA